MAGSNQGQTFSDINITPLTDIFLVLLIIMMVVAPMLESTGLNLATPSIESTPNVKTEPKTVTLAISASDAFTVDGQNAGFLTLRNMLREAIAKKPDGLVIQADPNASHNALTQAIDAAQVVGITKIAVQQKQ